jgi:hypothetical protein
MRRVIIESPYAGNAVQRIFNRNYARRCLRHALSLGEAPLASHLLYTQPGVLRDDVEADRKLGIDAGLAWLHAADASVVYVDRGISAGMVKGIKAAQAARMPIEYRAFDWAAVSGDADTMSILGRLRQMTRAELTEQAISFAYGNCAMVAEAAARAAMGAGMSEAEHGRRCTKISRQCGRVRRVRSRRRARLGQAAVERRHAGARQDAARAGRIEHMRLVLQFRDLGHLGREQAMLGEWQVGAVEPWGDAAAWSFYCACLGRQNMQPAPTIEEARQVVRARVEAMLHAMGIRFVNLDVEIVKLFAAKSERDKT